MLIKVVGMDPSLRNWGLAIGVYDTCTLKIKVHTLKLIKPVIPKTKQVRQNSLDMLAAQQLYSKAVSAMQGAQATFVEAPVGSQSARAMASYGICNGVLGSIRAAGLPFIEVSPLQVKLAGAGKPTASKKEMIDWAVSKHPEANWPRYKNKESDFNLSDAQAEHMADAIAAIYAGIASETFNQILPFLKAENKEKEEGIHANSTETERN